MVGLKGYRLEVISDSMQKTVYFLFLSQAKASERCKHLCCRYQTVVQTTTMLTYTYLTVINFQMEDNVPFSINQVNYLKCKLILYHFFFL